MRQNQVIMLAIGLALVVGIVYLYPTQIPEGDFGGEVALGLTIVYTDGTEEVISPEDDWLSYFVPLDITTPGGTPVDRMIYSVQVNPEFSGDVTSIDYAGSSIIVSVDGITKSQKTASVFGVEGLVSGSWSNVAVETISATTLESWAGATGSHRMRISPTVRIKLTFSDGTSRTRSAPTFTAIWDFVKAEDVPAGEFTSLSVRVLKQSIS